MFYFSKIYNFTGRALWVGLALGLGACSVSVQTEAEFNKQAILDAVDSALTVGDCQTALQAIQPLYESSQSDNDVRLRTASAYACYSKINFFGLIGDMIENSSAIASGMGFWSTMAKLFPSTAGSDYVVEGSLLGIDALQAVLKPGALILPAFQVNAGSYNIGSIFYTDRMSESNIYMTFLSMAAVGSIASRYGDPDPTTYIKRQSLPWVTYSQMTSTSDGCGLVSGMFNSLDAMKSTGAVVGGSVEQAFSTVTLLLGAAYDVACIVGCSGLNDAAIVAALPGFLKKPIDPATGNNGWIATGCSGSGVVCTGCPTELRDRKKCTGQADAVSCAAAGMVNFLNAGIIGWN